MTIKSDKWIRKMAKEKDMISPFEPKMVRRLMDKRLYLMEHQVMAMIFAARQNLEYLQILIAP